MWSVSRQNLMAADVARRGLTRFGEVHVPHCTILYGAALYCAILSIYSTPILIPSTSHPIPPYPILHYTTLTYFSTLSYLISSHLILFSPILFLGRSESEQHRPVYWGNGGQIRVRTGVRWEVRTHTHTHTQRDIYIHD